ncbi:MAG: DUF3667 domain-containing protein [Brevundimonas sp.]|jgi:hypothetical protein|uniref:DUF3667 domain-containing protein n=1 Tax=Brevundimonas sp. TaxID=1871086 RepID=UPI00185DD4F8|nr:DUF3667 domain-containing protein [Brevundimonas sp.]MBA4803204.1 DUF3667 domain-containing protein [Brevundimonas sp.]
MTDAAAQATPTGDPKGCGACGAALHGRYCHACGQDSDDRPRPLRDWVEEAFSEGSLVDGRTARTLIALATAPGRLLEAYRSAAGSRYQTPTKLFVVATALFLLALGFADVALYQFVARPVDAGRPVTAVADPDGATVHMDNVAQGELWMRRRVEPTIDPAVTAALRAAAAQAVTERDRQNLLYEIQSNREQALISERLAAWLPNALWLLMPLYALLLAPFFGRRRLLMEHLVFAMWAHVIGFGLLSLLALANKWGPGFPAWPVVIPYLLYFTAAASSYYRTPPFSALWRGAAHLAAYVLLVLMPATIVVAVSAMDVEAFIAFLMA